MQDRAKISKSPPKRFELPADCVGEESFPHYALAFLCNEKLLEILSLFPNESGHGWAQNLHDLNVNPLLCKLILHRIL